MTSTSKLKILFICSKNRLRSLTAEQIYRQDPRLEVRSAGTSDKAKHIVSHKDVGWAELIICMEKAHQAKLQQKFGRDQLPPIAVLGIPDNYDYMDPELIEILQEKTEAVLEDFGSRQ